MSVELVKFTTYLSIFIQFVTGFFGLYGLTYKLPSPHNLLTKALTIEMIVQAIEFIFYIGLVSFFSLGSMATIRYYDWFITTPTMLFTTCLVYYYLYQVEQKQNKEISLQQFIKDHRDSLILIVVANFMMLLFGYLGEKHIIDKVSAFIIGSGFLALSFYIIYRDFARYLKEQSYLFTILSVVWAAYGVVFLFPAVYKNIAFNFLDIIAKNFFGLFLFYKIRTIHNQI